MADVTAYQYRPWEKRLSRRPVLKGAAVAGAGLIGAAIIGCSDAEKPATRPGAKEPRRGGVLNRHEMRGGPEVGFDPATLTQAFVTAYTLWYQGLLRQHPRTLQVEPLLAERWEQPSETEHLFSLRSGVKWQNKPPVNGRELTVDDVVLNLRRVQDGGPRFISRTLLTGVTRIEAVDKTRVKITTKEPDATTVGKLASANLVVLAPEVLERFEKLSSVDAVVGTGAFILRSFEDGVGSESLRNLDYWQPGLPYLDGIRTRAFVEQQSQYAAFLAGQLHVVEIPGSEANRYVARQGPDYVPDWQKEDATRILLPNTRVKPFDDTRVTRALRLLVDHQEFRTAWVEVYFGKGQYITIFPTVLDEWDLRQEEFPTYLQWKQPKDDAAREAIQLLRAAGFTRDNPLKFGLDCRSGGSGDFVAAAELVQDQWRRWSQRVVDVELRVRDTATIQRLRNDRSFTYFADVISPSLTTEPDAWLSEIYHSQGNRNYASYSDSILDGMIERQRKLFDVHQRKAAVREIVVYMIDRSPSTTMIGRHILFAKQPVVQDYLGDYYMDGYQYERVWLDT